MMAKAKMIGSTHLIWALLVTAVAAGGVWAFTAWRAHAAHQGTIDQLLDLSGARAAPGFEAKVDAAVAFVFSHATLDLGSEFEGTWRDPAAIADLFLRRALGQREALVQAECSVRSGLLGAMLTRLGIRHRFIDAYSSKDLQGHTFPEVWNPEAARWETVDPQFLIHWRATGTGQRASLAELSGDLASVEPCGLAGCGWEQNEVRWIRHVFELFVFRQSNPDKRLTGYTPRADLSAVYETRGLKGGFCDVLGKNCKDGFVPIAEAPALLAR
jgi:hypothetical protein